MSIDHDNCEKVIRVEAKVEELKERMSLFDQVPAALTEISTTLKHTIEYGDRREALIREQTSAIREITEKHSHALYEISGNMKLQTQTIERLNTKLDQTNESLNHKIDCTDAKVAEIDKKLNAERVKEANKWTIHFADIWKWSFWVVLGGAATILIPKLFAALGK